MRSLLFHRSKAVLTILIAIVGSLAGGAPNRIVGQEPPSVYLIEQQIRDVCASVGDAVVRIDGGDSNRICESGVIVSKEGYVLSRGAFMWSGELVKMHLSDGRTVSAKALGWSLEWSIGVWKIVDEGDWPFVEIGSTKEARVGQPCLVIGYATRGNAEYDRAPSVRYGAIKQLDAAHWLTTTCVVSTLEFPAIFSMDGELIGIVSREIDFVGFATAADVVTENWEDLIAGKNLDWVRFPPQKDSNYRANIEANERLAPDDVTGSEKQSSENSVDLAAAKKIARETTVRLVSKSRLAFDGEPDRWSGVIVTKDGHILTCGHTDQIPGEQVTVRLSDGGTSTVSCSGRTP